MSWKRVSLHHLLTQYLDARGADENRLRQELADGIQEAVRRHISRFELRDAQDIGGDCVLCLLMALQRLKVSRDGSVQNFDAFVFRTVVNRVNDEFRKANPERRRLDLEVKHLLRGKLNVSGFGMWSDPRNGVRVGGFVDWCGRAGSPIRERLENPRTRHEFASRWLAGSDPREAGLAELVAAVLNWHGGPAPVRELIDLVCTLRGVERINELSLDREIEGTPFADMLEDPNASVEDTVLSGIESQERMRLIWRHLRDLASHQFHAVCLKLEPDEFLALAAVAGPGVFAGMLGVELRELAEYASALPLRDDKIAWIVGLDARQIPSVRKKALQRVARRLGKDSLLGSPGVARSEES